MSSSIFLMLSSRGFVVAGLVFKFLIYFELTFLYCVRQEFYSFSCGCPVFSTHFIENTILSPLGIVGSLVKYQLTIYVGCISGLFVLFFGLCVCFYAHDILFKLLEFVVQFEIRKCGLQLCSFSRMLWLFQPKCPSTDDWIRKMWYIYTMKYYSAIKKNDIMPFAATWMELENLILSEMSQKDNTKYHIISLITGI